MDIGVLGARIDTKMANYSATLIIKIL